jgi:hypothetical protein
VSITSPNASGNLNSKNGQQALPWTQRADELTAWVMRHLVNRVDAWGGYWRKHVDGVEKTLPTTRPHPHNRGKIILTERIIANHFTATQTRAVIGLHSTSPENTSRWGAVDVDCHGPSSTSPDVNLGAVLHWYCRLQVLGFRPLLTASNGRGGYHLRVLFREVIATAKVHAFMRWLTADHAAHGMRTAPEIFPKQPRIKEGGFGNFLRVPGRHHTLNYWSKVWDGTRGLEGHAAIDYLLSIEGDDASLIPAAALAPKITITIRAVSKRPFQRLTADRMTARIRGYLAKLPAGLGEGQGRDDQGYSFAAFLLRDLGLSDADALLWLVEWDARNAVAKGSDCLLKLIASAHAYGKHAYRSGLDRSRS